VGGFLEKTARPDSNQSAGDKTVFDICRTDENLTAASSMKTPHFS
jgi:hypothetical protein